MEHGYGIKRAENLIDRMEAAQERTLFGPREKDLICNYAYHIEAFSKVEALAERLAQARFEVRHGYLDPALDKQVNGEIDRVDEIWRREEETGVLEYLPVPFTEFEEHDLTGVEYLLETGEKLHFCPTSEDYFVSENRLADGTLTTPHIYRAVWDSDGLPAAFRQEDGTVLENPYQAVGPEIGIEQTGVPYGLLNPRTEPGYVLQDGTALLECERDAYGNYQGGAGMDGMYLRTGRLYAPVPGEDGQATAFRELRAVEYQYRDGRWQAAENHLKAAEMGAEQNYNQIDGIINNERPRPSLLENLKQCKEQAGKAHDARDSGAPAKPRPEPER